MACRQVSSNPQKLYDDTRAKLEGGKLPDALKQTDQALSVLPPGTDWNWRFRVLKSEILIWQGKPKDAAALLKEDLPPRLSSDVVAVRQRIVRGTAAYYARQFDEAATDFAQAEQIASAHHPELLGDVMLAQGTLEAVKGDYVKGAILHRKALQILRQQRRTFVEASALGNLGYDALRQEHFDEAIGWFTRGGEVADRLNNDSLHERMLGNLGYCYLRLGDFEKAEAMFQEAQAIAAKLGEKLAELTWVNNLGNLQRQSRDFEEAAKYYERALEIAREIDNKPGVATALNNLAAISLDADDYDAAEKYNREALEIKRALGDKASERYSLLNEGRIAAGRKSYPQAILLMSEVAKNSEDISLRWEAESELARVYEAKGDSAHAEAQFRRALATVDRARASISEQNRLSFLNSADTFYNAYIDFLVSRGRVRDALAITEHSRARTLAEGLKIPTRNVALRPEETARRLKAVILAYWLKPGQSYGWVVTARKVALFKLPAKSELDPDVQTYGRALRSPLELKQSTGVKLYETLIAPAQKLIPRGGRVIVIGDGSLLSLNFETLLSPKPQLHYWIEDAVVSNASSISLLAAGTRRKPPKSRDLLLIGNPVYNGTEYPALAQAKSEVSAIAAHFAPDQRTVIEGAAAMPDSYAAADPAKFSFLHFVAHGTASQTSPLESSIVLSPDATGYKLYARDIMTHPLNAELVTISACYGAGSRTYAGEGLVGLSWAFLRAGAHNVVAASWEVSDTSTPQLMDAMYAGLAKGEDPQTALRAAKLQMLHSDSVYRRPFYWGAFQVYSGS